MKVSELWTRDLAIQLAIAAETVCQSAGCHVALTGGCLYKSGPRKDCDLLFYRIRQSEVIFLEELWAKLKTIGLEKVSGRDWVYKGVYQGRNVDMFFPEEDAVETHGRPLGLALVDSKY